MSINTTNVNRQTIKGIASTLANNVTNYQGIPFALIQNGRWTASRIKPLISQEATSLGPICPQNETPLDQLTGSLKEYEQSEECLNLNISSPSTPELKPVMVWIHGGGFAIGGNTLPSYQGDLLAEKGDVVVVSINYRLGPLGFLRLKEVTNGAISATGNEGLLDQIEALKWIKQNIHHFGGDSNNLTLFGESAGAMSISCLLAMPEAKGLFHKVILQSGAGHTFHSKEKANQVAKEFLEFITELGVEANTLQQLPISSLLKLYQGFIAKPEIYLKYGILPFKPVIDGETLLTPPYEAIEQGVVKDIPILSGTNTDEWTLFGLMSPQQDYSDEEVMLRLSPLVEQNDIPAHIELAKQKLKAREITVSNKEVLAEFYSHFWFHQPSHRLLQSHQSAGGKAYCYSLAKPTVVSGLRCTHIADIGYVFGLTSPIFHGSDSRVTELTNEIQTAWTTFARTGDPSTPKLNWPEYTDSSVVCFDQEATHIQQVEDGELALWEGIPDQVLSSF